MPQGRVEAMAPALAAAFGCNATIDWRLEEQPYYPPTVNDGGAAAFARRVAIDVLGSEQVGCLAGCDGWWRSCRGG